MSPLEYRLAVWGVVLFMGLPCALLFHPFLALGVFVLSILLAPKQRWVG